MHLLSHGAVCRLGKQQFASDGFSHHVLPHTPQQVNCLQITPDKNYIAAAGHSHVRLFEIQSQNPHPVSYFLLTG